MRCFENSDYYYHDRDPEEILNSIDDLKSLKGVIGVHSDLIYTDSHGIYIPKMFAENFGDVWGLKEDIKKDLNSPSNPSYWETWEHVLMTKQYIDENDVKWFLEQDGDLFRRAYFGSENE